MYSEENGKIREFTVKGGLCREIQSGSSQIEYW